mmetsp:Transcript_14525/g.42436  ORF Transcript_14525/g.42436 Transcript_14525/m.42436 type:complete len:232 (-) Transcript_14525:396-1091(-)
MDLPRFPHRHADQMSHKARLIVSLRPCWVLVLCGAFRTQQASQGPCLGCSQPLCVCVLCCLCCVLHHTGLSLRQLIGLDGVIPFISHQNDRQVCEKKGKRRTGHCFLASLAASQAVASACCGCCCQLLRLSCLAVAAVADGCAGPRRHCRFGGCCSCCCRVYSYSAIAPLTCTLSDRISPSCGISSVASSSERTSAGRPSFSRPSTSTHLRGNSYSCRRADSAVCSSPSSA